MVVKPTIFAPQKRDAVIVKVGGETVDLTRIPMGGFIDMVDFIAEHGDAVRQRQLGAMIEATAALCAPINPAITPDFLRGLDAFDEAMPFTSFVMELVKARRDAANAVVDLKNENPSSS